MARVPVEPLDTVVAAETPEGILLELRPAGLSVRLYAFLLDWMVRLVILYMASFVLIFLQGLGLAALFVLYFALEWFYPVFFELARSGASPGKQVFGIKVVMDNGLPVTPAASFTRNLLRVADFMPAVFGFAIVSMLLRRDCKRLGDLAAGTLVVHQTRASARTIPGDVAPLIPVRPLAPVDQAAVIALATRAPTLTVERLDELAGLAASVSGDQGRAGSEVTVRVLGVAQWLLGRRT